MINGQSDCGILPLLFDFSIHDGPWSTHFVVVASRRAGRECIASGQRGPSSEDSVRRCTVLVLEALECTRCSPAPWREPWVNSRPLHAKNSGKKRNSTVIYWFRKQPVNRYLPRYEPSPSHSNYFTGVQDVVRIKRLLDAAHDRNRLAVFGDEKSHLAVADAVFAGAGSFHCQRPVYHPLVKLGRL